MRIKRDLPGYWMSCAWYWWVQKLIWLVFCLTVLACAILAAAVYMDDRKISQHSDTTQGTVMSTTQSFTLVHFFSADGTSHYTQQRGINFPSNLAVGQRFLIDYDQDDPSLVRVHGRGISLMIWPLLSVILGSLVSMCLARGVLVWLKRTGRVQVNERWSSPGRYVRNIWEYIQRREELIEMP